MTDLEVIDGASELMACDMALLTPQGLVYHATNPRIGAMIRARVAVEVKSLRFMTVSSFLSVAFGGPSNEKRPQTGTGSRAQEQTGFLSDTVLDGSAFSDFPDDAAGRSP